MPEIAKDSARSTGVKRSRWTRRRKLAVFAAITAGATVGAVGGIAYATTYSTSPRNFATPYVGGADLFDCGVIQSSVQVGPPASPAPTINLWGTYGVYCAAGAHNQYLKGTNSMNTGNGLCYGPYSFPYTYTSNTGSTGSPTNCGHGQNYYGLASGYLLIPFSAEYSSGATNGGYPEISGALYWP